MQNGSIFNIIKENKTTLIFKSKDAGNDDPILLDATKVIEWDYRKKNQIYLKWSTPQTNNISPWYFWWGCLSVWIFLIILEAAAWYLCVHLFTISIYTISIVISRILIEARAYFQLQLPDQLVLHGLNTHLLIDKKRTPFQENAWMNKLNEEMNFAQLLIPLVA